MADSKMTNREVVTEEPEEITENRNIFEGQRVTFLKKEMVAGNYSLIRINGKVEKVSNFIHT